MITYNGMTTEQILLRAHKLLTGVEPLSGAGVEQTVSAIGDLSGWKVGIGYQYIAIKLSENLYPLIVLGAANESSRYGVKGKNVCSIDVCMMMKAVSRNSDVIGAASITRAWANMESILLANGFLPSDAGENYTHGVESSTMKYGVRMTPQNDQIDEYTAVGNFVFGKETILRRR